MFLLEISLLAQRDIDHIQAYTLDRWGERQLEIYRTKLEDALSTITENPLRYAENAEYGLRILACGRHRIFYHVDQETVFVARVLHERMDPSLHIGDDH